MTTTRMMLRRGEWKKGDLSFCGLRGFSKRIVKPVNERVGTPETQSHITKPVVRIGARMELKKLSTRDSEKAMLLVLRDGRRMVR